VIFDLDGTLVHTIEDISDSANLLLKKHGYDGRNLEEYISFIGNGARKFIERAMEGRVESERLPELVREFKEFYAGNLSNKSRLYEQVPEVLNACRERRVKMAVLSNKPHHLTLQVVEHYLSAWDFKAVFGQRDQVPRKPDPAAAHEISAILGVPAENTLFVGDSKGDMMTAVAAGMIPVGVRWGYGQPDEEPIHVPYHILDRPVQIIELIKN